MKRQRNPACRTGSVFILFAMLVFGILGFAALVIDLGFVRLTARQMKQATDVAALEALRFADVDRSAPQTFVGRNSSTELGQRQAASEIVTDLFDDDFNPAADEFNFGAGPQVNLTGGIELTNGFRASQLLTIPDSPVYRPVLELNESNSENGDIVVESDSVTIQFRRSNEGARAGEMSNGGPLPLLFGRGTLVNTALKANGVSLVVTSEAESRSVVKVGLPQSDSQVRGALNFAISQGIWEGLPPNIPSSIPLVAGQVGSTVTPLTEIGQTAIISAVPNVDEGYVAIVQNFSSGNLVIGFGWVNVAIDPVNPANVILTKRMDATAQETMAAENATARLSEAWDSLQQLSDGERDAVIAANRTFGDPLVSPVLQAEGN